MKIMTDQVYDENFTPMAIADLLDGKHHFVIPSFQRGYRWEEKQVTDLLEDIKQFANDDSGKNDSYFLQPVVVKACKRNGVDAYEVLDGQQRLTTMLLLLKRLMRRLGEDEREMYEKDLYDIRYDNRPQLDFDNPNAADNIDSYYLAEAKRVIDDWFKQQITLKQNLSNFAGVLLYDQKRQVKIIWYAIDESSEELVSINTFNRLNKGKISLTSSELIKALFIMDYDQHADGNKLPAERLAMEWNEMERRFQDDRFWYFISDDNRGIQTRIDVLFDFVTRREEKSDIDYSYRKFQQLYDFCREQERSNACEKFVGNENWAVDLDICNMQDAWTQVKKTFDRLVAWYEDNLYYHYVGYLVAVGFTPLQVYNHLEDEKSKRKNKEPEHEWTVDDTELSLRKMIMERFKDGNAFLCKERIDEFDYEKDYLYLKRLLLLFNVECCRKGVTMRFAFDMYKKERWDVEHVNPRNDAALQEYSDRVRWLENVEFILGLEHTRSSRSKELREECHDLIGKFKKQGKVNVEEYKSFYLEINKFYSAESGEDDAEVDLSTQKKDSLGNLTLLDSATNREYKDAPFAYKRYRILECDKTGERFIPPCTRNLFLKYYSDSNKESSYLDNMRWYNADQEGYLNAIHETVDPIFDSVIKIEKEAQS